MKRLSVALIFSLVSYGFGQDNIVVQRVQGDVAVRHGVAESWNRVAVGDVLKPDDTMKTGKKGDAQVVVNGTKWIALPSEVIVDISDLRDLSQEELMLKLTMEKVRASSYEWKNNEMNIPNAAITHGPDRRTSDPLTENQIDIGRFEWNGTKLLYDNGYFSTSALKAMDVIRRYPPLGDRFENRLLVAEALEKASLSGEALNEYVGISQSDKLTPEQRETVKSRITQLRKKSGR